MTAPRIAGAVPAEDLLRLNEQLLGELKSDESIEYQGPYFVIGRLMYALCESNRVIDELLAERAGRTP